MSPYSLGKPTNRLKSLTARPDYGTSEQQSAAPLRIPGGLRRTVGRRPPGIRKVFPAPFLGWLGSNKFWGIEP